jgi:Pyruvate/2-oxoacid:ferredoxin oxidoreductase gamma subunit
MLGALIVITGIVRFASLRQAVKNRFSGEAEGPNLEALELGRALAQESSRG